MAERNTNQHHNDPSPSEIKRRAEEVRKKWNERQRKLRAIRKETPWMPPIVTPIDFPSEMSNSDP